MQSRLEEDETTCSEESCAEAWSSPSKKDWSLISSMRGKGLKVKKEDKTKIVDWVQDHPDVASSPLSMTHFWFLLQLLMI